MIHEVEHWRTVDDQGYTMPWYTRGCLAWLDTLDLRGKKVFEYGGGQSTLWYRHRGAMVEGVDNVQHWAGIAEIEYQQDRTKYLKAIEQYTDFDIVAIDGDFRDDCFHYALSHLKTDGVIIIDNWKQTSAGWPRWTETERQIKDLKVTEYPEPEHGDWVTITVIR